MIIQSFVSDSIPSDTPHIRVALYQGFGEAGDMDAVLKNLSTLEEVATTARDHGVHLLSFPELFLSGYDVTDAKTAHKLAEDIQSQNDSIF